MSPYKRANLGSERVADSEDSIQGELSSIVYFILETPGSKSFPDGNMSDGDGAGSQDGRGRNCSSAACSCIVGERARVS